MKLIFVRNGLLAGILSIVIFLVVRYGFYNQFLTASGWANILVFPILYTVFAFGSTWRLNKAKGKLSFRQAFSASYLTLFAGGLFFMFFVYIFFHWIDPQSVEVLREGLIHNLKKHQMQRPTENNLFLINAFKTKYFLSARFLLMIFIVPIMMPFYGVLSLIIGLFFRNK